MADDNNNSGVNTILIVLVLIIVVAALVWLFGGIGGRGTSTPDDLNVDVNLPTDGEGGGGA